MNPFGFLRHTSFLQRIPQNVGVVVCWSSSLHVNDDGYADPGGTEMQMLLEEPMTVNEETGRNNPVALSLARRGTGGIAPEDWCHQMTFIFPTLRCEAT